MTRVMDGKTNNSTKISVSDHSSDEDEGVFYDVDYESDVF